MGLGSDRVSREPHFTLSSCWHQLAFPYSLQRHSSNTCVSFFSPKTTARTAPPAQTASARVRVWRKKRRCCLPCTVALQWMPVKISMAGKYPSTASTSRVNSRTHGCRLLHARSSFLLKPLHAAAISIDSTAASRLASVEARVRCSYGSPSHPRTPSMP
jgi:hypothetical protein